MVLAGGEGTRLQPLTMAQAKPAVGFAHGVRIVDFVLSNLVNSQVERICLLVQYKPESLIEHVNRAWNPWLADWEPEVEVLPAASAAGGAPYRGTAEAVHRNLALIEDYEADLVAVFAADHVYRMDVRQMADFHDAHDAEVSVAAVRVPIEHASSFGIIRTADDGRILAFDEKPAHPAPMAGAPARAFASMGNYLFEPGALAELLEQTLRSGGTDFGRHMMPRLAAGGHRAYAYDFALNEVPGVAPYEERGYWRDVGTLDALAAARRDIEGTPPRFRLTNSAWPLRFDRRTGQDMLGLRAH